MNTKNSVTLAAALLATVLSVGANAAAGDKFSKAVNVTALIPSATFDVAPVAGNWPNLVELKYDETNNAFEEYKLPLKVKSGDGIYAFLSGDAVIAQGSEKINLAVKLDGKTLNTTPQSIKKNATQGTQEEHFIDLVIANASAISATQTKGQYTGTIGLQFEDKF